MDYNISSIQQITRVHNYITRICITQWKDQQIEVLYAEQFERPDFNDMLRIVYDLIRHWTITKVYVDGSNPAFVKAFKRMIREYPEL